MNKLSKLVIAIVSCELIGNIGTVVTIPAISTWYATLVKPSFNPPNWIFGPVWTILFALMGVSLYLVWQKGFKSKKNKFALKIFGVQFALNVLWSLIFFGLKNISFAFADIIFLWIAVALTIKTFYKISRTAAYLLIPYILWVSFATILNFYVWSLNLGAGVIA